MLASVAYAEPQTFHPFPYYNYPRIIPHYATPYQVTPQQATPYHTWYYNPYVNHAASLATTKTYKIPNYLPGDEEAVVASPYAAGYKIPCRTKIVSSSLKREILNIHNKERRIARQTYYPTDGKPKDLRWSDELARNAKSFLDRCDTEHKHTSLAVLNDKGENLAGSLRTKVESNFPSDSKYVGLVKAWMAEKT